MAYETLKVKGPVFMGTGGKDHDVPPAGQERLFTDACAAGSVIEHHVYPTLDHSGMVNGSLKDSTPFVKKAFAGEAIFGELQAGQLAGTPGSKWSPHGEQARRAGRDHEAGGPVCASGSARHLYEGIE